MNASTDSPWDFFPVVMCINLRDRTDRFEQVCAEARRVGLRRIHFFHSERQPEPDKGCLEAHVACLAKAVEMGVPHVLVLEDNVIFQPGHVANVTRIVEFLRGRRDWKFLHFGGFIFRKVERIGDHFIRGGIMCTHAYVVTIAHAKELIRQRQYYQKLSVDTLFTIVNGNDAFVHVNPLAATQRASTSDGTWDRRDLAKSGWLGKAMIYTSLNWREKLRFTQFPVLERIRIENGVSFFKIFRQVMKRKARVKPAGPAKDHVTVGQEMMRTGLFRIVDL